MVKLLAPAGSFESLSAAINAGADAIYFGVEQLNMRARAAKHFTIEDMKEIAKRCKKNKIKSYLTLNTIVYNHDMHLMRSICDAAKGAGVDAIIACDVAAIQYARSIGLPIHISTQANVSNFEAVKFYAPFADVIVLARELTLQQIEEIVQQIKKENIRGPSGNLIEIEIFIHGALCVAISGKCYMSLATTNASANRGACLQTCRRAYKIIDEETGQELVIDNKYVMSPKDLCTLPFLDKLINAGVSVLKIEGRGRPEEYVDTVTAVYKEAIAAIGKGTFTKTKIDAWMKRLESVFNRGFWLGGYYLGKQVDEWSGVEGSKATKEKRLLGKIEHVYPKAKVAHIALNSGEIKVGDTLLVSGPTTGVVEFEINELQVDEKPVKSAKKGDDITLTIPDLVRRHDKVFLWVNRNV